MLKRSLGVTLLEMIITMGIMSMLMVGIVRMMDTATEDAKASVTALHLKTIGDSANAYIKDNYSTITAVATATTPVLLRVSDLVASGHLTGGATAVNPRGQTTCVLVLEPTANNLLGVVVTEGGDTIDDLTLGQIAATVGGSGGGIYSTNTAQFRGAMGGWQLAIGNFANPNHLGQKCDSTAGNITLSAGHPVMALWFVDGADSSATLYRDAVPGNPSLNTMNTPILLGAGAIQTAGTACTTNGALGRDANGAVLACDSGTWKTGGSSFWQDPVANFAALPTCNAAALGQTRVVRTPTTGTGARAYTCNGSGTWQPLGVDDSGNMTVAGTATIDKLSGNLEITTTVTAGAACSPNGRIAKDSTGLILSCQSGVWRKGLPNVITCPSSQSLYYLDSNGNMGCRSSTSVAVAGSLCGFNDGAGGVITCQGSVPPSCPSGYTWWRSPSIGVWFCYKL